MDKSFRIYVDIFNDNNSNSSIAQHTNLERSLDSYDVVNESDILGKSHNECKKPLFSSTVSQDASGSNIGTRKVENNKGKLCGFLKVHKPSDKAQHRRRWFVFSEESCRLLYFRTPQDFIPRCDIDVASASFFIQAPSTDNSSLNRFEIRTKDNVYVLEAADQQTMLYWFQELQHHREHYISKRSKTLSLRLNAVPRDENEDEIDGTIENKLNGQLPLVENVSLPRDTVGLQTRDCYQASGNLTNLRDELRRMVSGLWQQRYWKRTNPSEEGEKSPEIRPHSGHSGFNLKRTIKSKSADVKQKILKNKSDGDHFDEGNYNMSRSASADAVCYRCSIYEDQIGMSKEELQSLEEELQATRELTWILQKQIDEFVRERQIQEELTNSICPQDTQTVMLQEQEKKIINLEHLLAATQEEKEILKCTNRSLEGEIESYKDQIAAFQDSVRAKDDVVINLTEQLLSMECKFENKEQIQGTSPCISPHGSSKMIHFQHNSPSKQTEDRNKELSKLKDMVNGYKMQNQFLNKEIMELNRLRQEDNLRLQELSQTCLKLETCYYDEHRKYLACLKELGKNQNEDESGSLQILQQLLEDALLSRKQWIGTRDSRKYRHSSSSDMNEVEIDQPSYDENGFPVTNNESYEEESFDDRLATIEKQSDELYLKAKSIEEGLSLNLQWEKYMANVGVGTAAQRSKELKYLIRAGIPNGYRSTVWKWCVDFTVMNLKSGFHKNYYENLIKCLKDSHLLMSPTAKQIELDLLRTLPGNKFYENMTNDKVQSLRRILLAFSLHDPVVGYCQGLNRIVAIALLFLEEEDSFWCLVSIVNCLLPQNYYCSGMQGAHTDQRVLFDLVQEKLPAIHSHLKQVDVDLTVFTFNWFLTIYIDTIPSQMYLRIWDSFLYEGTKVLFRYALAFLKSKEREILSVTDSSQMHLCLRSLGEQMLDVNKISKIAFEGINPFPMKNIYAKRQHHLVIVKGELDRMEEQRQSYRRKRIQTQDLISFDVDGDNFMI